MRCSSVAHSSTCAWGKAVATACSSGLSFFEGVLLLGVGECVPRTRNLQTVLDAHEIAPAQVIGDRVVQTFGDPRRDIRAGPVLVGRRRLRHRLPRLLLQRRRHGGWSPMRRRVPPGVHARRTCPVVAVGELTNPIGGIARHRRYLHRRVALAQQPQDLPPAALIRLLGCPKAALKFVNTQMRLEMDVSGQAAILQPPTSRAYDTMSDPTTATREVRAVVSRYIHILLYSGGVGGGPSGAEWDCKQELRRLGCNDAYIDSAAAYARNTGDDVWQQRFLFEQR
jgi:hypothetical protein